MNDQSGKRLYRARVGTDQTSVTELFWELRSTIAHAEDQGLDSLEVIVRE